MRIQDLVPKTQNSYHDLVIQAVATLLAVWIVTAALAGCTFRTIDAAVAQNIIQGVK